MSSVLISTPTTEWGQSLRNIFSQLNFSCEIVTNGKDCQLKAYQMKCGVVVLDLETKLHSALEVLKYLKNSLPSAKVIVTIDSEERLKELGLTVPFLKKCGAFTVLIKPFEDQAILDLLDTGFYSNVSEANAKAIYQNIKDLAVLNLSEASLEHKLALIEDTCIKFGFQIYNYDFTESVVSMAKNISEAITSTIEPIEDFAGILKKMNLNRNQPYHHLFMVTLLSAITCKKLEWNSTRTMETVVLASLLHNIGQSDCPNSDADIPKEDYSTHPTGGMVKLSKFDVPEPVKQVVYQHHERINGKGFPNGLSGQKIYPLAKILSLTEEFAYCVVEKDINLLDGVRHLLSNREMLEGFDPLVVKAFVKSFIKAA